MTTTTTTTTGALACPDCGHALSADALACPQCGHFLHQARLQTLANEALRLEAVNPSLAIPVWTQALALLPPETEQHFQIAERINQLRSMTFGAGGGYFAPPAPPQDAGSGERPAFGYLPAQAAERRGETWQSAILKTGGSMAFSILLFSQMHGWAFAVGFVLLIFVHEMGHVVANWYYGIPQSPPIFIGLFGAVIFLKGNIRNAKVEAIAGIAGPVFGTVGALACFGWYLKTGDHLARELAFWGFFLNAWNMLPVPPLDGGRATAAITPWVWALGLLGLVGFELLQVYAGLKSGAFHFWGLIIIFWILSNAVPRVRNTLLRGEWRAPYYRVGWKPRVAMTIAYFGLLAVLVTCFFRLASIDTLTF